jgi:threonine dehydrogenase-like Zn-dependent dehydrogenase
MQAVTVVPGTAGSARLEDVPEPGAELGSVVVEALAVGVCGTDAEIASGGYGWAPPGEERLILGHESLGMVVDPGPTGLAVGEHVAGIVRRPDPLPCPNCAVGEWDMCSNGGYTERGIKQVHGFMAERRRIEPEHVVRVDKRLGMLGVLLEPTTVVAKAWQQILSIGQRTFWDPQTQQAADAVAPGGIVCLTGVGSPSTSTSGPASALATDAVLKNLVMFGSVNANRRHYYRAAKVLANADRSWLEQLLTRRVRPDDVDQALARTADDIKVVMEFKQS